MNTEKLVNTWIALQKVDHDSPQFEDLIWSATEFNMLAMTDPRKCWGLCLEILNTIDDEWILTNLAAGPLENLLVLHPNETIEYIEKEMNKNTKLIFLLNNVWENLIPSDVWEKLKKLRSNQRCTKKNDLPKSE